MKKYVSCFLFFFVLTAGCLISLFFITAGMETKDVTEVQVTESVEQPAFAKEDTKKEEAEKVHVVLNQQNVVPKTVPDNFCLVSEEGYLIVYDREKKAVNLLTHIALAEFPVPEQEKLMEGIWFATMAEIFSYLESYTS